MNYCMFNINIFNKTPMFMSYQEKKNKKSLNTILSYKKIKS